MRIAIISDVHGNVVALRLVLAHLRRQSVDAICELGDCVSAPLWPQETFDELQSLGATTVRGNHDRWLGDEERKRTSPIVAFTAEHLSADAIAAIVSRPQTAMLLDGAVLAVHGTPASDTEYLMEDAAGARLCLSTTTQISKRIGDATAELIVCGHSHLQHAVFASGGRLVVNPGSVGCPRYAGNADAPENEAGSPHARYAVATRRGGNWSVEFFVLDYDWLPVVERARAVGHHDWAASFLNGA